MQSMVDKLDETHQIRGENGVGKLYLYGIVMDHLDESSATLRGEGYRGIEGHSESEPTNVRPGVMSD